MLNLASAGQSPGEAAFGPLRGRKYISQRASNSSRRTAEVIQAQAFISSVSVRLAERARSGTIQNRWNAELGVVPRIGVQRHAVLPDGNRKKALTVTLQRLGQTLGAGQRFQGQSEQDPANLDVNELMVRWPLCSMS